MSPSSSVGPVRQLLPVPLDDVDVPATYAADARPAPPGRPWVLANMVTSLDGAATLDGRSGGLGGPGDRAAFGAIRAVADVIVVGAGTVRAEGYRPPRAADAVQAARVARGQGPLPRIAIVSGRLDLDPGAEVFGAGDPLVVTHAGADGARRAALGAVAEIVEAGATNVDPAAALAALAERTGARVVLCEGGPSLLGTLLDADLVDELCLTLAPCVVGGDAPRLVTGASSGVTGFRLDRLLAAGDELIGRWVRTDR